MGFAFRFFMNDDLHGSAPDKNDTALLLVDVLNPLDFPEADQLLPFLGAMTQNLAALKKRCKGAGIPVIYANDNFGIWRSDLRALLERCREDACKGRAMAEALLPEEDDYFVLKPKHSAFFSTTLETLLRYLRTRTLIIGGVAGNICVIFTANDAYLRDFNVIVPADGVASNTQEENDAALAQMAKVLKADIRPARDWPAQPSM